MLDTLGCMLAVLVFDNMPVCCHAMNNPIDERLCICVPTMGQLDDAISLKVADLHDNTILM